MKDNLHQPEVCTTLVLTAVCTLSFVSHFAHILSQCCQKRYTTNTSMQFVPSVQSIRFLYLSASLCYMTTQAKQTCPNRRRLPKGGTSRQPEAILFDHVQRPTTYGRELWPHSDQLGEL